MDRTVADNDELWSGKIGAALRGERISAIGHRVVLGGRVRRRIWAGLEFLGVRLD